MQEVLPWIPGLARNFLVKPRTSWLTQKILGESCEESLPNQIFAKKNVCVFSNFSAIFSIFSSFWPRRLHYKDQKFIFECVYYIFCILKRAWKTRKFLICPETFGLKLLVSFLVSFRYPLWRILDFLVSFRYPFWRILDFLVSFRYPETYFCLFPKASWQLMQMA